MAWIKKQWKKLVGITIALTAGGIVVFNNGEKIVVTPSRGSHRIAADFGVVYANGGQQIQLKKGQRYIQIGMVLDSGKVVKSFADTLDTDIDIGILGKFTQCRK